MKKIPTLFVREYENHKVVKVTREFTNDECKRAFLEGRATVKFDGSCCAVIDGKFYKRYDAKKGKPIPDGAIGKHFQGNPYNHDYDILVPHGRALAKLDERTFESVKTYLAGAPQEGIVFWIDEKPVCKIKRTDFGFQWPIRE